MDALPGSFEKPRLYIAAPLFTPAERAYNAEIATRLEPFFNVFLPQRDGNLLAQLIADGMPTGAALRLIYKTDTAALRITSYLLIVLDGRTVDEGASFELGYAAALGVKCFGIQSDVRRLMPSGNNPMLDGALFAVFPSIDAAESWARETRVAIEMVKRASRV